MGNNASSSARGHHDETVDYGHLCPQGVYTGPRDWNQAIVSQFICQRRLAPYYRPLEEYDESWNDDQILTARKELPDSDTPTVESSSARIEANNASAARTSSSRRSPMSKEPIRPEAAIYRGAVECPICFLYYPPNINHSRCCDQAICTECFVQIKRTEPTATHLDSEPAACPYCVQDNFGVVYTPPSWRAGIGSESTVSLWAESPKSHQQSIDTSAPFPTHKRRQKSFGADSPEVVTTDQIRPDWEAKLAAVRAAVTRRANRRIIMRQVGDRLIPVGVTSGRIHAINPEDVPSEVNEGGSRRSRRRQQQQTQEFGQFMGSMGLGGQDLEELMIMEAMRLSMLDHEEQQKKEAEERAKKKIADKAEPESAQVASPSALELDSHGFDSNDPSPSSSGPYSVPQSHEQLSCTLPSTSFNEDHAIERHLIATESSRISTPSPQNTEPVVQGDRSSSGQHDNATPPLLRTLRAAPNAASTSTAALGPDDPYVISLEAQNTWAQKNVDTSGGSISGQAPVTEPPGSAHTSDPAAMLISRPSLSHVESFTSSFSSTESTEQTGETYSPLHSSHDSAVSVQPLLERHTGTPTTLAVPREENRDFSEREVDSQG